MDNSELRKIDHPWHVAINRHSHAQLEAKQPWPSFMYHAKTAAYEVNRLALLFKMERENGLAKVFRPCTCCPTRKHIIDNHLTCCLGVECRKCEHLAALDKCEELTPEQIYKVKAWTCVAHILENGGDPMGEGFIITVDDRMFWDRVCESLSSHPSEPEEQPYARSDGEPRGGDQ